MQRWYEPHAKSPQLLPGHPDIDLHVLPGITKLHVSYAVPKHKTPCQNNARTRGAHRTCRLARGHLSTDGFVQKSDGRRGVCQSESAAMHSQARDPDSAIYTRL
ncbi:unnamed protein product [Leptosia nina]|uniref:Uncharacterized protein n=1 Tax=Leptosia nina TaxID=320188 RepID=A0AAV1K6H3_9NEOP